MLAIISFSSCTESVKDAKKMDSLPKIYPDYIDVTIPKQIAPLSFNLLDYEKVDVLAKGSKSGEIHCQGSFADFDIKQWHKLLEENVGGFLELTVFGKVGNFWHEFKPFKIYVSPYDLDDYGITYRKIAPGYEVFGSMGLYQRDLSNYNEDPIIENTMITGSCVNCHTSNRGDANQYTFHIRGQNGGTFIYKDGEYNLTASKLDKIGGGLVYPYWHPSGKFIAYSTNNTAQSFHVVKDEMIEVFDSKSDVFLLDPISKKFILDDRLMQDSVFETYPFFSVDGKTLYFCASKAYEIPKDYKEVKYDLLKVSFDENTLKFGDKIDTVICASKNGKSLTFARPSYDGKYIMFTLSDYGCFPIWHKEADLYLYDIAKDTTICADILNSNQTDNYQNFSTNGRWVVYCSRRDDGQFTRLYFTSIDDNGNFTKPFMLPQRNPKKYCTQNLKSYNTPDFTKQKVDLDEKKLANMVMSQKRTSIE